MADRCRRIADSGVFQGFIRVVIVLNAVTLGIQTYDISGGLESALTSGPRSAPSDSATSTTPAATR